MHQHQSLLSGHDAKEIHLVCHSRQMSFGVPDPPAAIFGIQHEAEFVLDHGLADDVRLHCQVANEVGPDSTGNQPAPHQVLQGRANGLLQPRLQMDRYLEQRHVDEGNDVNGDETKVSTDGHSFVVHVERIDVQSVNNMHNVVPHVSLSIGQTVRHQGD